MAVAAKNNNNTQATWGTTSNGQIYVEFTVGAAPSGRIPPTPISAQTGCYGVSYVNFSWALGNQPVLWLDVSTDPTYPDGVYDHTNVSGKTSFSWSSANKMLGGLVPISDQRYYWRLWDGVGHVNAPEIAPNPIVVASCPSPTLTEPASGASNVSHSPKFDWTDSQRAESYGVYLALVDTPQADYWFKEAAGSQTYWTPASNWTAGGGAPSPPANLPNGRYRLAVVATNSSNLNTYGTVNGQNYVEFTVGAATPTPVVQVQAPSNLTQSISCLNPLFLLPAPSCPLHCASALPAPRRQPALFAPQYGGH
ncbi:MAG: hypothetical protein UY17_C0002G0002 [Candidatus Beckwithbacteria bacterium GW2011_GWC2_47_9]|uniref:Uncharacterized protein n=1 Tax=Candidatus Beckwithbacteria bacterium GW2011_GWC2_47_9 TaxID=1618373 RepID=A0A0G1U248_9BACT|nr:MAG: hypothetical protein UY17_C0002G0002 [Candidatus Beckwithbacteria bacterium GW2011_GWC2_47_9]